MSGEPTSGSSPPVSNPCLKERALRVSVDVAPPVVTPLRSSDASIPDRGSIPAPAPEVSDWELVDRLRRGDRGAVAPLYDRIEYAIVLTLTQVLGGTDGEREDLAQQALERVMASLFSGQFQGGCSLRSWASLVARRLAFDELRRRRRRRRFFGSSSTGAEEDAPAAESLRPDHQVESRSQLERVREALSQLTPEKADAVWLFDVLGHDLEEVARITGVSVAAAQTRLVRGRNDLRSHLTRLLGGDA